MVQEGDPAPDFALPDADGNIVRLSDAKGRYAVVYFYPKDDTSGCTKEAIDFTALKPQFARLGAEVFGISPDAVKTHAKFRGKHALGVTLLSDERADSHRSLWRLGAEENVRQGLYGRRAFDLPDRAGGRHSKVLARRQSSGPRRGGSRCLEKAAMTVHSSREAWRTTNCG